jgi:hypothetical protein
MSNTKDTGVTKSTTEDDDPSLLVTTSLGTHPKNPNFRRRDETEEESRLRESHNTHHVHHHT